MGLKPTQGSVFISDSQHTQLRMYFTILCYIQHTQGFIHMMTCLLKLMRSGFLPRWSDSQSREWRWVMLIHRGTAISWSTQHYQHKVWDVAHISVAFAFPLGCRRKEVTRGRIKPAGVFPSKQICHGNESLFFFFYFECWGFINMQDQKLGFNKG